MPVTACLNYANSVLHGLPQTALRSVAASALVTSRCVPDVQNPCVCLLSDDLSVSMFTAMTFPCGLCLINVLLCFSRVLVTRP